MSPLTKAQRIERLGRIDHRCRLAAAGLDDAKDAASALGEGDVLERLLDIEDRLRNEAAAASAARLTEVRRGE